VHHVGTFARLEDQLCSFTSDFNRGAAGYSPDRLDALVWCLSELMVLSVQPVMPQFGVYGNFPSNHLGQTGGSGINAGRDAAYGAYGRPPDSAAYGSQPSEFWRMLADIGEK
jgi:hypothetical protein